MAQRRSFSALLASLLVTAAFESTALAATRIVHVGQGGTKFVDAVSGTSTSTIAVGDTVEWTWTAGLHSTTSGPCATTCTADGLWDSGANSAPFTFSHTTSFAALGTYHYHCSVHGAMMQGDIVVVAAGPAPSVSTISPASGSANSGTAVTIAGTNFAAGAAVSVGGVAATGVDVQDAVLLGATTPFPLAPGTLNDVVVTTNNPDPQSGTLPKGWFADFLDVPQADGFHDSVEKIFRNGVTAGMGGGSYGRDQAVTRAQMAVFLLVASQGVGYTPPACSPGSPVFPDVPCPDGFAVDFIEDLHARGIAVGYPDGTYGPNDPVTRAQMAVFLLVTKHGTGYAPPACTPSSPIFSDVQCPGGFAVDWIEQLYADAVTGGCDTSPLKYCPDKAATRGEMAVFLSVNFALP